MSRSTPTNRCGWSVNCSPSGIKLESTSAGFEAELRIAGIGRFFGAAFLAVWLTGWVVGEAFALGILGLGAWSLLTGQPPGIGRESLRPELALPTGLFLLFWLALWTLGGVMAGHELLRLLFGRDRILVGPDTLEIERSYGLFRSREKLKRDELRRFYCRPASAALCVETARGTTELTKLGTASERTELAQALNAEFHLATQSAPDAALPETWCEVSSLERDALLVKNPVTRRKQAITTWIICVPLAALALYVASVTLRRPELWGLALVLLVIAVLVTWGAVWLSFGRNEWRLEKGRLVLQRRFGQDRTTRFEAVSVELHEDNSGDGDTSYLLYAVKAICSNGFWAVSPCWWADCW